MPARRFAWCGLRWPLRQITSNSSSRPSPVSSCLMRSGGRLRAPLGCPLCANSRAERTSMSLAPRLLRVNASLTSMVGTDAGPAAPFRLKGHIVVLRLLDDAVVEHFERAVDEDRVQRAVDALHRLAPIEVVVRLQRLPLGLEDEVDVAEGGLTALVVKRAGQRRHAERAQHAVAAVAGGVADPAGELLEGGLGTMLRAFEDAEHGLTDDHRGSSFSGTAFLVFPVERGTERKLSARPGGTRPPA